MNGKLLANAFPINKVEVFFDNEDHSHFLGFTWERVGAGRVPVGIDTTDSDFDTIGFTGGSKELQAHTHNVSRSGYWTTDNYQNLKTRACLAADTVPGDPANYLDVSTAGTGDSGNLQPYIVMAFWKRIA